MADPNVLTLPPPDPASVPQPEQTGPSVAAARAGELESGIAPSRWGRLKAALSLMSMDAPTGFMPDSEGYATRWATRKSMEGDAAAAGTSKLTPEEANKRYPGLPKPFDQPVYPAVAQLMSDDNQRRQRLQAWQARGQDIGPNLPVIGNVTQFVLGGLGSVADPANLALFAAGGAAFRAAGYAPGLAATLGENVAGSAVAQVPGYLERQQEHQDTDLAGEAKSALVGGVFGTAIHYLFRGSPKAEEQLKNTPSSVRQQAIETLIRQQELGLRPDISPIEDLAARRAEGQVKAGVEDTYIFQEPRNPSDINYYTAIDPDSGQFAQMGADYGQGINMVDNPAVARNHAGTPESNGEGYVTRVALPEDAKLLDLRESASDDKVAPFVKEIEEELGYKLELPENPKLSDVLDAIRTQSKALGGNGLEIAQDIAKREGYDGYKFPGVDSQGTPINNRAFLFDKSRAVPLEAEVANKDAVPTLSAEQARALSENSDTSTNQRFYDQDAVDRVEKAAALKDKGVVKGEASKETPELPKEVKQAEAEARARLAQRLSTIEDPEYKAELQKQIDDIDRSYELDKQHIEAADALAECIGEDIT